MATHPTDCWFDSGDGKKHKTVTKNDIRRAAMRATPEASPTEPTRKEVTRATSPAKTGPKPKTVGRKIPSQPHVTPSPSYTIPKPIRPTQTNLPPRPEKTSSPNDMAGLKFPKTTPNTDALAELNKIRNGTSADINTPLEDKIWAQGKIRNFLSSIHP